MLMKPAKRVRLPALPQPGEPMSVDDVLRIEKGTIKALSTIEDISVAESFRRKAKAIEAYLRSPELQRPILGAQRRIEGRIGQLLGPAEPANQYAVGHDLRQKIESRSDREDFRLLARALIECELGPDEWRKSRRALVALIRNRLGMQPIAPDFPLGKFQCLVVDPPWQQQTGPEVFHGTGERGHDELTYGQLSVEKITNFKDASGRSIADLVADDAHLYLWTINKYIEPAYDIARAWGFKPSVLLTWCKDPRGVGLGDTFRLTTEFVLFCRRGSLPHMQIIPTTWFNWKRGKHSAKPDEFYKMVESVTPGTAESRVDIFARKQRENWIAWGNEVANADD